MNKSFKLNLLPTPKLVKIGSISMNTINLEKNPIIISKSSNPCLNEYQFYLHSNDYKINKGSYYLYNESNDSRRPNWILKQCEDIEEIEGAGVFHDGFHHIWCNLILATSDESLINNDLKLIPNYFKETFITLNGKITKLICETKSTPFNPYELITDNDNSILIKGWEYLIPN